LYEARDGWIAVAALEPHFARRLGQALEIDPLTRPALAQRFAAETAAHWESWARGLDLPIVAVRLPTP
jgi:crotonobetainyl-CoA:carnitine CoA-transferase CaiB-like acyl-CoA transferase